MRKILVFGITENPGGVESVIMNYYRNIDRNQIQFDFLCNTDVVAYEEEIKQMGGNIYRITARSCNRKKYKNDMKEFFKKNASNYIAIWVNVCSLANIDYLKYAKKYGIKKRIIHSHNSQNMDSLLRGMLHRWNKLFIKKYATDFWSCSPNASKWFYNNNIINSDKYLLVNNAIDYDAYKFDENIRNKYRKELGINEETLVIGNVGRMHFQKNHSFIIKVFYEIHKKVSDSELILVGDGPDREKIENMVKKYNLENCVRLLGVRSDVNNLMQVMDIFLFPSLFEGLPLALVEAQAANLPIYASDVISQSIVMDKSLINYVSLSEDEVYWANRILKNGKSNRKSNHIGKLIQANGYDIRLETKKIKEKFEGEK